MSFSRRAVLPALAALAGAPLVGRWFARWVPPTLAEWDAPVFEEVGRVTERRRVYHPRDPETWVDVERITRLSVRNTKTGEMLRYEVPMQASWGPLVEAAEQAEPEASLSA